MYVSISPSIIKSRMSITTLKKYGNVCFCQMIYLSNNYYYFVWIDDNSFINIERLDF